MDRLFAPLLLVVLTTAFSACEDPESPTDPITEGPVTLTIDASTDWVYVHLAEEASVVSVANAGSSSAWDIGFFATSVSLNGGAAGPGGVDGYCVCQNDGAIDAEVMAMTDQGALAEFEGVSTTDIPTDEGGWLGDALSPAITGWWSYDINTHTVSAAPDAVWKVRAADGTAFAKLHVVGIENPAQTNAGLVTLEFAVQAEVGSPFGSTEQLSVDVSGGSRVYVDLQSASITETGWDLALEGYNILVNGGVSGDGQAGAVTVEDAFDDIEDASDLTTGHYAADVHSGVFATDDPGKSWYRYNLDGQHQIWPTYNVYLVRRGDEVFKIQLTGYYSDIGHSRHITFRYEELLP